MTLNRALNPILPFFCLAALAVAGCDDDDDGGNGLGPAPADVQEEAGAILQVMSSSADSLDLVQVLAQGQEIPGVQGRLIAAPTTWTFEGYSPDGVVVVDGVLDVAPLNQPMTVKGDLEISIAGSTAETVGVDLTIDITDPDAWVWDGTVTYKGYPIPVADLVAAAAPGP